MAEVLTDPATADSFDVTKTPFNRGLQTDHPLFAWFNRPENHFALKTFGIAMRGSASLVPKDSLLQSKPAASIYFPITIHFFVQVLTGRVFLLEVSSSMSVAA